MCNFPHTLTSITHLECPAFGISSIHQIYDVDLHNYHMTGFISSIESCSFFPSLFPNLLFLSPLSTEFFIPTARKVTLNPQKCRYCGVRVTFLAANLLWLPSGLGGSTFLYNFFTSRHLENNFRAIST